MTADLNDTDKAALIELLRQTIAADPYPLSRRIRKLQAILDKVDPPPARPEPLPPPKRPGTPSLLLSTKKGRRR